MRQDLIKYGYSDAAPDVGTCEEVAYTPKPIALKNVGRVSTVNGKPTVMSSGKRQFRSLGLIALTQALLHQTWTSNSKDSSKVEAIHKVRTPRHTTTAHSEAPPNLEDEDADIVADHVDREAFPDGVPDLPVENEEDIADLFMSEEADEDATVTALLLAGVEDAEAKMYAARVVGPVKAETFYEV